MSDADKIFSVTLDLVRSGPAQNQLLSPLTPYIALCNNQPAETFHVAMEHADWLDQTLNARDVQTRAAVGARVTDAMSALLRLQRLDMTRFFGSLRSLQSEMSGGNGASMIHIRLRLSAWELAGIPFELADAPDFFPGPGRPMLLGRAPSVVITRETRRVTSNHVRWPDRPRILFAWFSPDDDTVPHEAHLFALYRAIRPWCGWAGESAEERTRELARHLTVLPSTNLLAIERACRDAVREARPYTHVHVLAHGREIPDAPSHRRQFGLLLGGSRDGRPEVIDGTRFSVALNTACGADLPAVVTLATCESASTSSAVISGGGTLAHALHDAGVSLVVASQFPLSKVGSVTLATVLYEGFLRGEDPRRTLCELRQTLRARGSADLDWASVVAYGTIERDMTESMQKVALWRLIKQCDVTLYRAKAERRRMTDPAEVKRPEQDDLDEGIRRLKAWKDQRAFVDGKIASLLARWVDARLDIHLDAQKPHPPEAPPVDGVVPPPPPQMPGLRERDLSAEMTRNRIGSERYRPSRMPVGALIRDAAELYEAVHAREPGWLWGLVQNLQYRAALDGAEGMPKIHEAELTALEHIAEREIKALSTVEERESLQSKDFRTRKLEAELGRATAKILRATAETVDTTRDDVLAIVKGFLAITSVESFLAFSTRRVFRRLWRWLPERYEPTRKVAHHIDRFLSEQGVADEWHERY